MFSFKKYLFFIVVYLLFSVLNVFAQEYGCITETSLSGLIQDKRKFLKESQYFDSQNVFEFTESYTKLTEKQNSREKNIIFENYYLCSSHGTDNNSKINCIPDSSVFNYSIIFFLNTGFTNIY